MASTSRRPEIATLIREGKFAEARLLIGTRARSRMRTEARLQLAYQANQVRAFGVAASLLFRRVKPSAQGVYGGSEEERAEYGYSLAQLGCIGEASRILGPLDPRKLPRLYRFQAFTLFRQWEWNRAADLLRGGLTHSGLSEMESLTCRGWFASALLHGRRAFNEAIPILEDLRARTGPTEFRGIHWIAWHTLAQAQLLRGDAKETRRCAKAMASLVEDEPEAFGSLYARKWNLLAKLMEGDRPAIRKELAEVQEGFRAARLFGPVRSIDYYIVLVTRDPALLSRLYFLTPFPAFRQNILSALGMKEDSLPTEFDLALGKAGASTAVMNLLDGRCRAGERDLAQLKPGQAPHRMLSALAEDAYFPPTSGMLHELVFSEEHFNPASAPSRVGQVMMRLRRWLEDAEVPLQIRENHGFYTLASERGMRLRFPRPSLAAETNDDPRLSAAVAELARRFGEKPFSASEAEEALSLRRSSAVALLREGNEAGLFEREGAGPATRYRVAKSG